MKLVLIIFDRAFEFTLGLEELCGDGDQDDENEEELAKVLTLGFSGPIAETDDEED